MEKEIVRLAEELKMDPDAVRLLENTRLPLAPARMQELVQALTVREKYSEAAEALPPSFRSGGRPEL